MTMLLFSKAISSFISLKAPDGEVPGNTVNPVLTPTPVPTSEPKKTPVPRKTYLTDLDPMEKTIPVYMEPYISARGTKYNHSIGTLSGKGDAYAVYCLNKEYTEMSSALCMKKGGFLDDTVSVTFYSVEPGGIEYNIPIIYEGEEVYTLEVDGYEDKKFSVDVTDVDILRIDLQGYDPNWAHISGVVLGDPVLQ